jgi:hypothetical protein
MTKAEIVEALRCAADLCARTDVPVFFACRYLDASQTAVTTACRDALGRPRRRLSRAAHRHDLLEAAQRIEESE